MSAPVDLKALEARMASKDSATWAVLRADVLYVTPILIAALREAVEALRLDSCDCTVETTHNCPRCNTLARIAERMTL